MATLMFQKSSLSPSVQRAARLILGMCAATAPAGVALCEDKPILPKDKNGNVDWSKVPGQFANSAVWDTIAKSAGSSVRLDGVDLIL
jgi:hypothetical protein